jgi:hypothetical protein
MTVFGKAIFVGRRTSSEINGITLGDEGGNSSRGSIDLFAIVSRTCTVYIKASDNLGNRGIETKNDLDMSGRVLQDTEQLAIA